MTHPIPTHTEKADAADRWIEAEERLHKVFAEMRQILAEGAGPTSSTGPHFPFIGSTVMGHLDQAQHEIWTAHKLVAVQAYDERREAKEERVQAGAKLLDGRSQSTLRPGV